MSWIQITIIIMLVLIIVPIPLAWIIGSLFPDGNMQKHSQRIRRLLVREWKRIFLYGTLISLMFIFARDYVLQVTLIGAAILIGRAVALSRNK
ncbi:MAG: hypothetical protein FWC73_02335 [Defluviitaleaceae bacterium]|nr:hypothetical protein [Defluviitaleaceae bacterium]